MKSRILKLLLVLIILLLIAVPSTIYYIFKNAENSLYVNIKSDDLKLDIGDEMLATDCIEDYSGKLFFDEDEASYSVFTSRDPVSYDDYYLNTDDIGEHTISGYVEQPVLGGLLAAHKTFSFTYSVIDSTPPVMLWSGDGVVLEKGSEFNISDVIGYGDDADPKPSIEVNGSVDTNTVGDYPLHVTVRDASGNSVDWDLTIHVAENLPAYEDSSDNIPFKDFKSAYAGDGRSFGIDVSNWQDDIDFEAVKKAGCEFVIIRIGYSEDGSVTKDKRFEQNFERARAAGLKTGIYLYSYDNTADEARSAARWVTEQLGGAELDLPIVFDWEDFGQFQTYEMSFIELNKMYDAFAEEIQSAGYESMLYGSKNYLEKIWTDTDVRPIWLAHYTDETDYKGPYRIWQASSSGRIDGISGDVDLDILYLNTPS